MEEARAKIDITRRLTRLAKIEEKLDESRGPEPKELSSNEIGALKLDADIQFRLLAKILPDLKQVDMTIFDEERPPEEILSDIHELVRSHPEIASLVARIEGFGGPDADDAGTSGLPN